jgi:superfamily II DNA/RNA helicase
LSFEALGLSQEILDGLQAMRFENPTPIQEQCIPVALSGKDIVASAQTGTGKTAAFVIPILEMVKGPLKPGSIRALILTPTRELALQIDEQIFAIGYHSGVTSATIYGGGDWGKQERALKEGVHIVVATPGRLIDHMRIKDLDFSELKFLVLDEADRMLDMGFQPAMQTIMARIPKERQTLLFSATISPRVEKLCEELTVDPVRINIASQTVATGVSQYWYEVPYRNKVQLLEHLITTQQWDSTIVFAGTKRDTAELARVLEKRGLSVVAIHGDREQAEREQALHEFRTGKVSVIVATDVMARGIDIDGISHVVNFDVPRETDDYIHRIGRTARANTTGVAITFCSSRDRMQMEELLRVMGDRLQRLEIPAEIVTDPEAEHVKPVRMRRDTRGRERTNRPLQEGAPREPRQPQEQALREPRPPQSPRLPREPRPEQAQEPREERPPQAPRLPREPQQRRDNRGPATFREEPMEMHDRQPRGPQQGDRRGKRPDRRDDRAPRHQHPEQSGTGGIRYPKRPATHTHRKDSGVADKPAGLIQKVLGIFGFGKKK